MELKLWNVYICKMPRLLLIVPYGIETHILQPESIPLLLLIVPYGIETAVARGVFYNRKGLLIVPYGIETNSQRTSYRRYGSFNRTLWN